MGRVAWWATVHGVAKETDLTGHTQEIQSQGQACDEGAD